MVKPSGDAPTPQKGVFAFLAKTQHPDSTDENASLNDDTREQLTMMQLCWNSETAQTFATTTGGNDLGGLKSTVDSAGDLSQLLMDATSIANTDAETVTDRDSEADRGNGTGSGQDSDEWRAKYIEKLQRILSKEDPVAMQASAEAKLASIVKQSIFGPEHSESAQVEGTDDASDGQPRVGGGSVGIKITPSVASLKASAKSGTRDVQNRHESSTGTTHHGVEVPSRPLVVNSGANSGDINIDLGSVFLSLSGAAIDQSGLTGHDGEADGSGSHGHGHGHGPGARASFALSQLERAVADLDNLQTRKKRENEEKSKETVDSASGDAGLAGHEESRLAFLKLLPTQSSLNEDDDDAEVAIWLVDTVLNDPMAVPEEELDSCWEQLIYQLDDADKVAHDNQVPVGEREAVLYDMCQARWALRSIDGRRQEHRSRVRSSSPNLHVKLDPMLESETRKRDDDIRGYLQRMQPRDAKTLVVAQGHSTRPPATQSPVAVMTGAASEQSPVAVMTGAASEQSPVAVMTGAASEQSPVAVMTGAASEQSPVAVMTGAASEQHRHQAVMTGAASEQSPVAVMTGAASEQSPVAVMTGAASEQHRDRQQQQQQQQQQWQPGSDIGDDKSNTVGFTRTVETLPEETQRRPQWPPSPRSTMQALAMATGASAPSVRPPFSDDAWSGWRRTDQDRWHGHDDGFSDGDGVIDGTTRNLDSMFYLDDDDDDSGVGGVGKIFTALRQQVGMEQAPPNRTLRPSRMTRGKQMHGQQLDHQDPQPSQHSSDNTVTDTNSRTQTPPRTAATRHSQLFGLLGLQTPGMHKNGLAHKVTISADNEQDLDNKLSTMTARCAGMSVFVRLIDLREKKGRLEADVMCETKNMFAFAPPPPTAQVHVSSKDVADVLTKGTLPPPLAVSSRPATPTTPPPEPVPFNEIKCRPDTRAMSLTGDSSTFAGVSRPRTAATMPEAVNDSVTECVDETRNTRSREHGGEGTTIGGPEMRPQTTINVTRTPKNKGSTVGQKDLVPAAVPTATGSQVTSPYNMSKTALKTNETAMVTPAASPGAGPGSGLSLSQLDSTAATPSPSPGITRLLNGKTSVGNTATKPPPQGLIGSSMALQSAHSQGSAQGSVMKSSKVTADSDAALQAALTRMRQRCEQQGLVLSVVSTQITGEGKHAATVRIAASDLSVPQPAPELQESESAVSHNVETTSMAPTSAFGNEPPTQTLQVVTNMMDAPAPTAPFQPASTIPGRSMRMRPINASINNASTVTKTASEPPRIEPSPSPAQCDSVLKVKVNDGNCGADSTTIANDSEGADVHNVTGRSSWDGPHGVAATIVRDPQTITECNDIDDLDKAWATLVSQFDIAELGAQDTDLPPGERLACKDDLKLVRQAMRIVEDRRRQIKDSEPGQLQ